MNQVQLVIIAVVGVLILLLVGYFWYQEVKFKKMVEQNFNHKTFDAINEKATLVIDGVDSNRKPNDKNILERDFADTLDSLSFDKNDTNEYTLGKEQPLITPVSVEVAEVYPDDSVEAIFANIKKNHFPYAHEVELSLDYIINVVFEDVVKIKILPDIASFTQKQFKIYILENNQWVNYVKGTKYNAIALKVVVHLVDKNGIINQAQIDNIYRELFKFTMQYKGFIEQSNFENSINKIREQVKYLSNLRLDLELFLIMKNPVDYISLTNFFMTNNFTEIDGKFNYMQDGVTQFIVTDEQNNGLQKGTSYSLLRVVSNLHFVPDPNQVVENILNIAELFVERFEARLLTTNKQLFSEKEYNSLTKYINTYVSNAKKCGVELGGGLIRRLL